MLSQLVAFTGVAAGMIMLPGADFTVVVRNAVENQRRGMLTGVGVALGLLLHTTLTVAGLAAVVTASPGLLEVIRYGGAAYLVYLGVSALMSAAGSWRDTSAVPADERLVLPGAGEHAAEPAAPAGRGALEGFLTNALNPKAPLLFLSLMPRFVPPGWSPTVALTVMSLIVVAIGLIWFVTVALTASRMTWILRMPSRRRTFDVVTGTFLVLLAGVVAAG